MWDTFDVFSYVSTIYIGFRHREMIEKITLRDRTTQFAYRSV